MGITKSTIVSASAFLICLILPQELQADLGSNWTCVTSAAPWIDRQSSGCEAFNGNLWLMGGAGTFGGFITNDVWRSTDGSNWIQVTAAAPWKARTGHASVVFQGKIWIMGGSLSHYPFAVTNDVWYTADGTNWVCATPAAAWPARGWHGVLQMNGKLWVLGAINDYCYNDVWSSVDGSNWVRETADAPWGQRYTERYASYNGNLYVMGGIRPGGTPYLNDVWRSPDGTNWTLVTANAPWWPRSEHGTVVFEEKLWMMGGQPGSGGAAVTNDVWWTVDGSNWIEASIAAAWPPRLGFGCMVFANRIWVIGGGGVGTLYHDVWKSEEAPVMAFIPAGPFVMGNDTNRFSEMYSNELPMHTVNVSAFYMDKYEVTKQVWDDVYAWAVANGYAFDNAGAGKAASHPVQTVNWYDCVKWCNARSEREGRIPCYYTDAAQTQICRIGQITLINDAVKWTANGYRLPTEAEWEKAARGGVSGHRFPWSDADTIQHARANYQADTNAYPYDASPTLGYHPAFNDAVAPYTSPAGYFAPNGYGLYDMAGNVWEWTWDWYDIMWYGSPGALQGNSPGPNSGTSRVMRGGSWYGSYAVHARCAFRNGDYSPEYEYNFCGFRCVRRYTGPGSGDYCVIDVSAGPTATNYPVTYFTGIPELNDEYKTTKILLRKIPAGSFVMGSPTNELGRLSVEGPQHTVTLSSNFYMGVFEITQAQYTNVMGGSNPSSYPGVLRPVEMVSWNMIRGGTWPGGTPTAGTFMNILRTRTGLACDLPTEAQWEYACRAGTTNALNNNANITNTYSDANMDTLGRYYYNGGDVGKHTAVGSYQMNNWSLYDMHGNVSELCLDWSSDTYGGDETDPTGPASGPFRKLRGGSCGDYAYYCRSAGRNNTGPDATQGGVGFRLCMAAPQAINLTNGLVAWWKFDENTGTNAVDSSGNNHIGVIYNTPTWIPGIMGSALSFNGSNQYCEIPESEHMNFQDTGFTLAAFARLAGSNYISGTVLVGKHQGGAVGGAGYFLGTFDCDNFTMYMDMVFNSYAVSMLDAQWHHVAGVYDSQLHEIRLYVDGMLAVANAWTFALTNAHNINIARCIGGSGQSYFFGGIDDVRIYNRPLSSRDIQALSSLANSQSTPMQIAASDGTYTNKVAVSWSASSNATKYAVWRNTSNSTNGAANISGDITTTNYDDTAVTPGQTYWYWVKAGNNDGWSDFSASDNGYAALPNCPSNMALIPAGPFTMGNCMTNTEGNSVELPLHSVYISAFYMDKCEVSYTMWTNVHAWAIANGYAFDNAGAGKATNHPVQSVNWYDCVKWCNARSEMEELTPCYYTDAAQTQICRIGQTSLVNDSVNWTANGYRLPTEAEWEKAARGGVDGHRFPWSDADTISHVRANYRADTNTYAYDISPTLGYHPTFAVGGTPYTSPVGYFAPNSYGLYDMAGNVWEWTWDWNDNAWYGNADATQNDTRGPASSTDGYRVIRGADWLNAGGASYTRCAFRGVGSPSLTYDHYGFRCARGGGASVSPQYPPANVAASDGTYTNKVAVTWAASSNATKYAVWRSGDGGGQIASNWTCVTSTAAWAKRNSLGVLCHGNALWVIGGSTNTINHPLDKIGDVWRSTDGTNWTLITSKAPWIGRDGANTVTHQNKMWVMGGRVNTGTTDFYTNDVWSSSDGTNWTCMTACAPWEPREFAGCVEHAGSIFLLGGQSGRNDVWSSIDGTNWTRVTALAPWSGRHSLSAVSYDGKLWVMGGWDVGFLNDVWSSADGTNWTKETGNADWSPRGDMTVLAYNNRIVLMAGMTAGSVSMQDVWTTINGSNWILATSPAPWPVRARSASTTYNGYIWLMAGASSSFASDYGDVWRNTLNTTNGAANISGDITTTNYDDTAVVPGTTYCYWVQAGNAGGWSDFSAGDAGFATFADTPPNMALIPAGPFTMGDTFGEGNADELPLHSVYVSAFYMDKTEVTYALWSNVYTWAISHAYTFDNVGSGKATNHPVQMINWYDCVKWCNARSEMEGLTPCYYTDAIQTQICRIGQISLISDSVNWNANGYRLPTEAEWEKVARGGLSAQRFPWQNINITHTNANYLSDVSFTYDTSATRGYHPTFATGAIYTSPVGYFDPNDYGLYDMAGNVFEWTWDWYDSTWYGNAGATQSDTSGPVSGTARAMRGGGWNGNAYHSRVARRHGRPLDYTDGNVGFRCARGLGSVASPQYPPANVSASDGTYTNKVSVTWTSSSNATQYAVWRNTSNSTNGAANISGDITSTNYDDSAVTPGQTYWYWVKAGNADGWSDFSANDSGYAALGTPVPTILPTYLDFATNVISKNCTIANAGGGSFTFTNIVTSGGTWLGMSPQSGTVTSQAVPVVATVNRSSLTDGSYTGLFSVTPSVGGGVVVTCVMVVAGNSVVAHPGGPYVADQGSAIILDGSASMGNNLSYSWRVGSGAWSDSSPANRYYSWTGYAVRTNTVYLFVEDDSVPAITHSASTLVMVRNVAPSVDIGGPYTGKVNQAVSFRATIADPGTGDTHEIRWDFGSGWSAWQPASATNTSHTFVSGGSYGVQCEVLDNHGGLGSDTATAMIDVPNLPPTARATLGAPGVVYSNYAGMHMAVVLDGSGSVDDRTASSNLFFDWREDVDNPSKPLLSDAARQQSNAAITFVPLPGTYKFHLVVNDGEYNSESATVQANIPGLAGTVKSDGIGAVLPLYGVTLTVTNQALGQVFSDTTDMEGRYALDTGVGNGRIVVMDRNGLVRTASVNVDADGIRNYVLTYAPQVCSFTALVNSGYYGGVYAPIPGAFAQIVIGSEVGFNGAGDLSGQIPFGGVPELWPRNLPTVNYQVLYQKPGWESQVQALQPDPAVPAAQYPTLSLSDSCTVQGLVVGTNSLPARDIAVNFGPAFSTVLTDADGRFAIAGLMRGEYYVKLSASDFDTTYTTVNVPPGDTNIALPQPLVIRGGRFSVYGEICNAENGMPIFNATARIVTSTNTKMLTMLSTTSSVASTRTGYYDLPVVKGARTMVIEAPGYEPRSIPVNAGAHVQQPVQLVPIPEPAIAGAMALCVLGIRRRAPCACIRCRRCWHPLALPRAKG